MKKVDHTMRTQTFWLNRFHLEVDMEAQVLDCFWVDVLGSKILVNQGTRTNVPMNQLWAEMLWTVQWLQKEYHRWGRWKDLKLYSALDLQPFAVVTACEEARERVKSQINLDMICGGTDSPPDSPPAHERKVRHLDDALDGLTWLEQN